MVSDAVERQTARAVKVLRPDLAATLSAKVRSLNLGVAVLTGVLAWGCGPVGPNDIDVDVSFTGTHDAGVCTFVFRAKATQPEQTVNYSYELGALRLITPTTFGAPTLLEDDLGSFRDSLRRTWDFSLGTQGQIGRLLRFRFTAGFFQLEDAIKVVCPT